MKLPKDLQEYRDERAESGSQNGPYQQYSSESFKTGFDCCFAILGEPLPEFDEQGAKKAFNFDDEWETEAFVLGARWRHEQLRGREGWLVYNRDHAMANERIWVEKWKVDQKRLIDLREELSMKTDDWEAAKAEIERLTHIKTRSCLPEFEDNIEYAKREIAALRKLLQDECAIHDKDTGELVARVRELETFADRIAHLQSHPSEHDSFKLGEAVKWALKVLSKGAE